MVIFNPTIPVGDIAVLVIDRKHPRFGQLCRLNQHDWREFGILNVGFADGTSPDFPDGLCPGDSSSPVRLLYRKGRLQDPMRLDVDSLKQTYLQLGIDKSLAEEYWRVFKEQLP